jgi:hypothetical protein
LYIILTIIVSIVGLNTLSAQFPIENLFFSFKSPEAAFKYFQDGRMAGNIVEVVEGKSSSMIVFSEDNDFIGRTFIAPITEKGYILPSWFSVNELPKESDAGETYGPYWVLSTISNVVETNDYYYYGFISANKNVGDIFIYDYSNIGIKYIIQDNESSNMVHIFFYGYVENLTSDFHFFINDEKVLLHDQ